jgi:lipid-A-disaccharide synthase
MRIFLIAGEPSGDKLGASLMAGLRELADEIQFSGIGGPMMAAQGLHSRFDMAELSVMGITEVLPKYRALMARINETARAVLDQQPDVLITIDSPDFCLRVARRVKAASTIRTVHYVAPSVWAWRAGRAQKMARSIDHVLALLPFEPPYMRAAGMRCDFVGHPVVSEPTSSPKDIAAFRAENALGDARLILVLPGSRRNEVARLAPTFGEALRPVLAQHPDARVVVPAAAPVASAVIEAARTWPGTPLVLDPRAMPASVAETRKRHAFAAADVALAASGTVSLELAAANTPMAIAYDLNWLSWQIMSRMAKIDTVTLVNLVTQTPAVPEFLGPDCRPDPIAKALNALLDDPEQRIVQTRAMSRTMHALGQGATPPGLRAAHAVLEGLDTSKPAR